MNRSVNAEVDLEPGKYSVLMKVVADLYEETPLPIDVIRKSCIEKRDKLLQVGLSYDMAHAKGETKESQEEMKKQEKEEAKNTEIEHKALNDLVKAKVKELFKRRAIKITQRWSKDQDASEGSEKHPVQTASTDREAEGMKKDVPNSPVGTLKSRGKTSKTFVRYNSMHQGQANNFRKRNQRIRTKNQRGARQET